MTEQQKLSRNEKDGYVPSKPSAVLLVVEETVKGALLILGAWLVVAHADLPRQPRSCATLDFAFFYFFLVPLCLATLGSVAHDVVASRSEERSRIRRRTAAIRVVFGMLVILGLFWTASGTP